MKILVVGSDKIFAIENFYVRYLRGLGNDVVHFPSVSMFYDFHQKNVVNKIFFKLGFSGIYQSINKKLKQVVKRERPDVIWVFKGLEIFPDTLRWIKGQGIPLANFNGDNPFLFSGRGSGNQNITNSLGLYDLHFTYNLAIEAELRRRGYRTAILPFGFDLDDQVYERCTQEPEIIRVCFLGNPDKDRSAFIMRLAEKNIPMTVFGNHWSSFVHHPGIEIHPPVYGEAQWRALRRYRVQLNLMRPHNPDSHNMRTFEVPGVGGIMLAPRTREHLQFFEDGREAFFFSDITECIQRALDILAFTTPEALKVREAARTRSLESGYRYEDRARSVDSILKSLIR